MANNSNPDRLSLPAFIKLLTSSVGLSASESLGCASALIKAGYNAADTPNPFVGTSEVSLVAAGVTDPDVRKTLMAYGRTGKGRTKTVISDAGGTHRKRKSRDSDLDDPFREKPAVKKVVSMEFDEELEYQFLHDRSVVINRAPVMTAWATVVAERLGFSRQEALSIAHTYTNMNASAKGVSLGIYSPEEGKQKTHVGPSQPYVELMGRKIPMLSLQTGEWRGIANSAIAEPEQAFGYIQRSFRHNMSAAMGAFRLLAESYEPDELNKAGYQLYADFRPEVTNWGQKAHLYLKKVLDLRKGSQTIEEDAKAKEEDVKAVLDNDDNEAPQEISVNVEAADVSTPNKKEMDESCATIEQENESPKKKVKLEAPPDEFDDDNGGISDSDLLALEV